jgi:hypothetical protein
VSEFLGGFQIFGKCLLFVSVCGSKNVLKEETNVRFDKEEKKGKSSKRRKV